MDAVEFLKEHKRMCGQIACESCPLYSNGGCDVLINFPRSLHLRECVEAVEQWAKDHPVKTRQSELLKMFPKAATDSDGVSMISPCYIENVACVDGGGRAACDKCRRDYWFQEVE